MIYFFFLLLTSLNLQAQTLKVVTSDFPPFQFVSGGKVIGITTEIVEAVVKNAGFSIDIKSYPWPRTYKMGLKGPGVLIYSIVKTPERAQLFKWIGVIAPYDVYFWKLKSRKDIKITSVADAKAYNCGGVIDDNKSIQLQKLGFVPEKNLDLVASDEINVRKLFAGRIDIMTFDLATFRYKVQAEGLDFSKFERMIKLQGSSQELQLAASLDTTEATVKKLRAELVAFKKTKQYKEIKTRFK